MSAVKVGYSGYFFFFFFPEAFFAVFFFEAFFSAFLPEAFLPAFFPETFFPAFFSTGFSLPDFFFFSSFLLEAESVRVLAWAVFPRAPVGESIDWPLENRDQSRHPNRGRQRTRHYFPK